MFDPGLGLLRAGFFFSRYGFNSCAIGERPRDMRKNKQREKTRAGLAGLIARPARESRKSTLKTGQI